MTEKTTYNLGTGTFYRIVDKEPRFCALGIYLVERHGWKPSVSDDAFVTTWETVRENDADIATMTKVFLKYKRYRPDEYVVGHGVYAANDDGAPPEIIKEALAAVGVDVDLIDKRAPKLTWDKYPDASGS